MPLFRKDPFFLGKLRAHFQTNPMYLPVLSETFDNYEHPNIHLAIESYISQDGRSGKIFGIMGSNLYTHDLNLANLLQLEDRWLGRSMATEGPVQYVNIPLEGEQVLGCVQRGLYLIRDPAGALAILVQAGQDFLSEGKIKLEVMAANQQRAEGFLATLRGTLRRGGVYQGKVLVVTQEEMRRQVQIHFHPLPSINRQDIILPHNLLERIERQTIGFEQHRDKLRAMGRHLKHGLLFHGPPGTGKTLTAMFLARHYQRRTVLLISGPGLGLIGRCCTLARILQPALLILEDVDLIAEERTRPGSVCTNTLLFELLNEMDGLAEDADVHFLLTTNRPDILEPALASRPGRIDQAFEIPLPDAHCRRRLFELYGRGLQLGVENLDPFIKRSKGASGAFIREMMRQAALFAAENGQDSLITDTHLSEAMNDLVLEGKELTKNLLGFRPGPGPVD